MANPRRRHTIRWTFPLMRAHACNCVRFWHESNRLLKKLISGWHWISHLLINKTSRGEQNIHVYHGSREIKSMPCLAYFSANTHTHKTTFKVISSTVNQQSNTHLLRFLGGVSSTPCVSFGNPVIRKYIFQPNLQDSLLMKLKFNCIFQLRLLLTRWGRSSPKRPPDAHPFSAFLFLSLRSDLTIWRNN